MKFAFCLCCFCFVAHGVLFALAICRSAKIADEAIQKAFKEGSHK